MIMMMTRWAVRLLACHPLVQERLQAELDQVTAKVNGNGMIMMMDQVTGGRGGAVTWEMRERLPYTVATLREIMRFADIAPTGLVHKTVCDVSLGGFSLEQDTLVMANHSACHKVYKRTMFVTRHSP